MKKKSNISPFLFIYKPQITSMFSILHRVSGLILVVFTYLFFIFMYFKDCFVTNYYFYKLCLICYQNSYIIYFGIIIFLSVLQLLIFHIVFGLLKKYKKINELELNGVFKKYEIYLIYSVLIFVLLVCYIIK